MFATIKRLPKVLKIRNFCTETELTVPTFCDVYITLPFDVYIKPLDIHKYHNCDKLLITTNEGNKDLINYEIIGNRINISSKTTAKPQGVSCTIRAPIKANLYADCLNNIYTGFFNGDKLHLKSQNGNIEVKRFLGESIDLTTKTGHIRLIESVQAANIRAQITDCGTITTEKLQGIDVKFHVKNGIINVGSSYASNSNFKLGSGEMFLRNVHKTCEVSLDKGKVLMTAFDGQLKAQLGLCQGHIQLSRLSGQSQVNLIGDSKLNLKLSEDCTNNVNFLINSREIRLCNNLKIPLVDREGTTTKLNKEKSTHLKVDCPEGTVNVEPISFEEMFQFRRS